MGLSAFFDPPDGPRLLKALLAAGLCSYPADAKDLQADENIFEQEFSALAYCGTDLEFEAVENCPECDAAGFEVIKGSIEELSLATLSCNCGWESPWKGFGSKATANYFILGQLEFKETQDGACFVATRGTANDANWAQNDMKELVNPNFANCPMCRVREGYFGIYKGAIGAFYKYFEALRFRAMAVSIGAKAYICLADTFDSPRWREALIINVKKDWVKVAVRAKRSSEVASHFATFEADSKTFFLAELKEFQLRAFCSEPCLKLGVEDDLLVKAGEQLLESDSDLCFATASEPDPRPKPRAEGQLRKKQEKTEASSSSEDSSEEEDILAKLQKSWRVEDMPDAKHTVVEDKKRFPMLEKKSKQKPESDASKLDPAALLSQMKGQDPLQTMLALQLAETFSKKSRRKKRSKSERSSPSSSGTSSSSSDSSADQHRRKGHARAIESYQQSKKRMFRKPLKEVRKYVREIEKELGAEHRPFRLSEVGRRIPWQKQKSLQRCHYMLSEILSRLLKNQPEKAALQTVLCLRACHQAALDNDWGIAWLLTHLPDPWSKKPWGGSPDQLGEVTAYLKSMSELSRNAEKVRLQSLAHYEPSEPSQSSKEARPKKDKKGKGKGKDREKDEEKTEQ
eukprot:s171_g49.t1